MISKKQRPWIIFILGLLSALSPFSTDMYLPAFPQIAQSLQTTAANLSLSLSSYFLGIAFGQIFYGPLLDRFGRKKPLYVGLSIYIIGSVACILTKTLYGLIFWRFISAAGGCVATVVGVAMVRDLFSIQESPKVFSQLMLVLGVSPLLAPIVGSTVSVNIGWQAVFIILIIITLLMILGAAIILPNTHHPDSSVILSPLPILRGYYEVSRNPQFYTYAFSGGVSFASLFVYIAASPLLFFKFFNLDAYHYCLVFTILAAGFVGASQLNILLLRWHHSVQILKSALVCQVIFSLFFLVAACNNCSHLGLIMLLLFGVLVCIGLILPNATMQAMVPFSSNAGRASALMSTSQMLIGALASSAVGFFYIANMCPIAWMFVVLSTIAGIIFLLGKRNIVVSYEQDDVNSPPLFH